MSDRPPQRPDFCPFIYTDGVDLFLEFDPGGVVRFTLSEGGLSKALKHIPNVTRQPGYVTGASNLTRVLAPKVKVAARTARNREAKVRAEKLSPSAKSRVRDIVRKMG